MSGSMTSELIIKNLHANIEGKPILRGVDLTVKQGEIHALMGPNGSGKSTLANVIMGNPKYEVTEGEIWFKGENILNILQIAALACVCSWHSSTLCLSRA